MSPGQASLEGFSLQTRIELVLAALAANEPGSQPGRAILVLGGNLPSSEWGDPQIARATFGYLRSHPWMHVLDADDLVSIRTTRNFTGSRSLSASQTPDDRSEMISQLVRQLMGLSPSLLQQNAWQALFSLYAPAFPATEELAGLREIYLGQVNTLIEAARWSTNPQPISTCDVDLDLDQQPECVLASDRVFIVTKLETGALVYAFARSGSGVHQIIAPSAQFAVGTSSPAGWVLTRGLRADSDVIPGAFADDDGPYSFNLGENRLSLVGNGIIKTYQLSPHGIVIQYQSNHPVSTRIPIALDPWVRFSPAWGDRYSSETTSEGWAWMLQDSLRVFIRTNAIAQPFSFTETRKYVSLTEDPNRDYPPGHYLPFPLSVVSIHSAGDFFVDIQWEYIN